MGDLFRIGIVGCGGMGGGHAIAIASGTGNAIWNSDSGLGSGDEKKEAWPGTKNTDISVMMELAGVYDIDPARQAWAAERGYYNYENYEAMLQDETVDAILIATPNHLHKEMALAAFAAGKHVLCEKPVMMSSADLEDVLAAAKEAGKVFYPRQNREYDDDFKIIQKIYDEKLVGNVFDVECRIMGSRGIPGDWRGIKEFGGGMMLDWGVHIIDRLLVMVPEKIKKIFCSCTYITNKECDDGFKLHITFESGMTALLQVGTCHFINLPLWTIFGDQGSAYIKDWSLEGRMMRLKSWEDKDTTPILAGAGLTKTMAPRQENSVDELPLPEVDFDHNELYANFVDTCRGKAEQIITGEHALRVLRVMEAAMESDEKGIVVHFE